MYARTVQHQDQPLVLTFAVSGKLWKNSLVMIDDQTKSLWSHHLGRCMEGELEGTKLPVLNGLVTNWGRWKKRWPQTTTIDLDRTSSRYRTAYYQLLDRFLVGLADDNEQRAWTLSFLDRHPVYEDEFAGMPLLILYDRDDHTTSIFNRKLANGTVLKFEMTTQGLKDQETGSLWNEHTGIAISGSLQGTRLELQPSILSFVNPWMNFHPDSSYAETPVYWTAN